MLDRIVTHLSALVAADTSNPPRAITPSHPIFLYVSEILQNAGFCVHLDDLGDGSVNLLASRGDPTLLINCHLDTVPADPAWTRDPWELAVENDRAIGLGACDIKGAAACVLAAAQRTTGAVAILFSSDEEAGPSRCVASYLKAPVESIEVVLVSEPTGGLGITQHRGLATCEIEFVGQSGHSSDATARSQNAIHHAVAWGARAVDHFTGPDHTGDDFRFNLGVIRGGAKSNMIASSTIVHVGLRPPPEVDLDEPLRTLRDLLPQEIETTFRVRFSVPALTPHPHAADWMSRLKITPTAPVDFWTEAALFTRAGLPAIVFGPGDIVQAHSASEYVALEQLERVADRYCALLGNDAF